MYVWKNKWVCVPEFINIQSLDVYHKASDKVTFEHLEELKNHHTLFRKKVCLPKGFTKAELYISADDYYVLYVNGTYVTQGPANSYHFSYNYNVVDITKYLHSGENTLFVHVYYQGLINRAFNSADYRQGMIADLVADGVQLLDNEWKYSYAKEFISKDTIGYETQFYDIIDNNLAECGREMPEFDDTDWEIAPVNYEDDHTLVYQFTPNVVCEKRLPVTVTEKENGCVIDFGQEIVGVFSAVFVGRKNQCVNIYLGEELQDGNVRSNMRCNCDYSDKFILRDGKNLFLPYEYKAFRYVQLIIPDGAEAENICAYYRHYPFENITKPKIENQLLSKIWDISKNAVVNCSQEGYLDCPGREKGQYLGDLTVTAHSHIILNGDTRLLKKALLDFANSAKICPGLMAVAPGNFMQEIADFSLLYPYQVYLYYKNSKDTDFVREIISVIDNMLAYFDKYAAGDMLLENVTEKWNLVDWPVTARDNYDFELTEPVAAGCHNVINALYCGAYKYTELLKRELGIAYSRKYDALRESFRIKFFDEQKKLFRDTAISMNYSLHSNIFPLFFELAPNDNNIISLVREKGLECSPYMSYYVLMALGKSGEYDLMRELLTGRGEHSWYNMIKEGATATFEAWGKEQKANTSLCHAWASTPIVIIGEFPQVLQTADGGEQNDGLDSGGLGKKADDI